MTGNELDIVLRLVAAVVAGALIGIERTLRGRPAGFRTHALVCLSSAMLMVIAVEGQAWLPKASGDLYHLDPTRIAQGLMTGIGFLGAGVIFKDGPSVRGLTTAASIWATAALGIMFGVGIYYQAALATGLILIVLTVFLRIEGLLGREYYTHHKLRFERGTEMTQDAVHEMIAGYGFGIAEFGVYLRDGGAIVEYRMVIHGRDPHALDRLAQHLLTRPEITEFQLTPTSE